MVEEKKGILSRLRDVYVEKRLDLLKRSYQEWEKTQDDFLKAMQVNKDLAEIETEIEKLVRMRQGIESRVRDGVGHRVLYSDFVDDAERKLSDEYMKVFGALRKYKGDDKQQYEVLKGFRKAKVF